MWIFRQQSVLVSFGDIFFVLLSIWLDVTCFLPALKNTSLKENNMFLTLFNNTYTYKSGFKNTNGYLHMQTCILLLQQQMNNTVVISGQGLIVGFISLAETREGRTFKVKISKTLRDVMMEIRQHISVTKQDYFAVEMSICKEN